MASLMQSTLDGRDSWVLRFYLDKRRTAIGLGSFGQNEAEIAKLHVELLIDAHRRNRPADKRTTRWLQSLPVEIYDRLAKCGLVEPRAIREQPKTVLAFMRSYIKSRTDWKKPCNYLQAVDHLEAFIGRDVPLGNITVADADRWHRWMIHTKGLSANTAGQNIKRCRQIMKSALDDSLIDNNPFTTIKVDTRSDQSKNRFIDLQATMAVLEACPDQEWRAIVALARFGGVRVPSEILPLRWSDINWERNRVLIHSPKTARHRKGQRIIPLWPELETELDALFSIMAPGTDCAADSYVIQSYRYSSGNFRTQLHRIACNAGVEKWPKPFIALRASRRTELERSGRFANHVLNAWFGHSRDIAEKHYLGVTEADYTAALDGMGSEDGSVCPFVCPSEGNQEPPTEIAAQKNPRKPGVLMVVNGTGWTDKYTQHDSNM